MVGINQVLKIGWDIVNNDSTNNNIRLQALSLINDCNKYKMDLTTNGIVITDAIKFVQQNSKEKLKSPEKKEKYNNNKESKEPNYNEDKEQQEEDQEKGIREISESEAKATTNQVF